LSRNSAELELREEVREPGVRGFEIPLEGERDDDECDRGGAGEAAVAE
jgi:hypothetical protein